MKPKLYPEERGNGTAKNVELLRVERVKKRQRRANEKKMNAQNKLNEQEDKTVNAPASDKKKRYFTNEQITTLRNVILRGREGFEIESAIDDCADWFSGTEMAAASTNKRSFARGCIKRLLDQSISHKSRAANQLAYIVSNYGKPKPEPVTAKQVTVDIVEHRNVVHPVEADPDYNQIGRSEADLVDVLKIDFNGRSVRMVPGEEPVFVAKDLVEAVGATWRGNDGIEHIPSDFRVVRSVRTSFGAKETVCLTEAGMNMYLFRSDKPAALPWQRHLAEVVLPSIRKTGRYEAPGAVPQLAPVSGLEGLFAKVLDRMDRRDGEMQQLIGKVLDRLPETKPTTTFQAPPQVQQTLFSDPISVKALMGHPRLTNFPHPEKVDDGRIVQNFRELIEVYGKITGNFEAAHSIVYDAISRDFDEYLRKRKHGTRMEFILSQGLGYKKKAYRSAWNALVKPYLV